MKRTYEQSLTFFKRETNSRGFGRELYKTPLDTIHKIVSSLLQYKPELKNKLWIDPCAGDGRWEQVIKQYGIDCKSFDIEPLNDTVLKQDFYDYNTLEDVFIIGNPPFSELTKFVEKSLSIADTCYFLGGSQIITGKLSCKTELIHRFEGYEGNQKDKRSKLIFEDTNNKDVIIWCCGALFNNDNHPSCIRYDSFKDNCFRTSVKCYCEIDKRIYNIFKGG
jgi:hypothetical protein